MYIGSTPRICTPCVYTLSIGGHTAMTINCYANTTKGAPCQHSSAVQYHLFTLQGTTVEAYLCTLHIKRIKENKMPTFNKIPQPINRIPEMDQPTLDMDYEEKCDCGCHMPNVGQYVDQDGPCCTPEDCNVLKAELVADLQARINKVQEDAKAKAIRPFPMNIAFHGIQEDGFSTKSGTPTFAYWVKKVVRCESIEDMVTKIERHFENNDQSKFVVTRVLGENFVTCYKRDMTNKQFTPVVVKAKFVPKVR